MATKKLNKSQDFTSSFKVKGNVLCPEKQNFGSSAERDAFGVKN